MGCKTWCKMVGCLCTEEVVSMNEEVMGQAGIYT